MVKEVPFRSFPEYLDPSWYCHLLTLVASERETFGRREELRLWVERRAADVEESTYVI